MRRLPPRDFVNLCKYPGGGRPVGGGGIGLPVDDAILDTVGAVDGRTLGAVDGRTLAAVDCPRLDAVDGRTLAAVDDAILAAVGGPKGLRGIALTAGRPRSPAVVGAAPGRRCTGFAGDILTEDDELVGVPALRCSVTKLP